ncbi:MAG: alpha/beta fold hydrolase [Deltaproteobacteria bacterium]|nr:MAG: alpha/beta fold hydrolase [Deltaproteobacteria bacterium]
MVAPLATPTVEEVPFADLHDKERLEVRTADGWTLVITRYKPRPQPFTQPVFGQPMLLVHGFAQNRRTWTSGDFVKNMLFFGLDLFILELRGHGKSSISLQRRRARLRGEPPPAGVDYGWDIDDYFLYDVPAAVAKVREVSGHERIFYCGHSMGGILGYGYAGLHPEDLAGLVTIGAPSNLGRGFWPLRLVAYSEGALFSGIDAVLTALNALRSARYEARRLAARLRGRRLLEPPPTPLRFDHVPMDVILKELSHLLTDERYAKLVELAPYLTILVNPERATAEDVRWLLREGADREPRRVLEQFARWIRNDELICYRTGFDFRRAYEKITIPLAIIFGDRDLLAGMEETREVYYRAQSDYLLWRPVKGNSHVELTMGRDLRQICYDIKNLVEYAIGHEKKRPSLPRRGEA